MSEKWIVSELPTFNGDGYHYGGGFVVTIPESGLSIQLGGGIVSDGKRWKETRALARLIAAAPLMKEALETAQMTAEAQGPDWVRIPEDVYGEMCAALSATTEGDGK